MTGGMARARDTPGRTAAPQEIDALLVVDMDKHRAHYECYRPGCQKPREEPIRPAAIKAFVDGIKARHMSQYHGEQR